MDGRGEGRSEQSRSEAIGAESDRVGKRRGSGGDEGSEGCSPLRR